MSKPQAQPIKPSKPLGCQRSLQELALRMCIRNAKSFHSVGWASYDLVKPILKQIDSAELLHQIELNSDNIAGEDAELWKIIINRDIPSTIRNQYDYEPSDPKDWYKVWKRLMRKKEREKDVAAAAIAKKMQTFKDEMTMKQTRTLSGVIAQSNKRKWGAPPPPKRQVDQGKSLISKIRGGMKDKNAPLNRFAIKPPPTVVTKAPAGMLQDYKAANSVARPRAANPVPVKPRTSGLEGTGPTIRKRSVPAAPPELPVEKKRLVVSGGVDESEATRAAQRRKRPPPTQPGPSFLLQPKRRKFG